MFISFSLKAGEPDSVTEARNQVQIQSTYTYLGYSIGSGFSHRYKSNTFTAGFRTSLTYTSNKSDLPLGFYLSFQKRLAMGKIEPFAEVFFSKLYFKMASPDGKTRDWYKSGELYAAYGMKFRISKRFSFSNSIGVGYYRERFPNFYGSKPIEQHSIGYFIKLDVGYAF